MRCWDEAYSYDAFGNQTEASGDTNPFRYSGEYYDAETGLIYLRARYYDSGVGAFISEDPAKDGFNWYVYCGGNPVNFWDPSGMIPTVEEAAAMADHIYGDYDLGADGKAARIVDGWRLINVVWSRKLKNGYLY